MNKETKAIIFDFFGVIANEIGELWFKKRFSKEESEKLKPTYFEGVDLGKITISTMMENLSTLSKSPVSEVEREWNESLVLDQKMIELIKKLKLKYKIGLCTNAAASFINPILPEKGIENLFDAIVISSEIGVIKPSPEIYIETLKRLSISPSEALFIDDNEVNIKGAEAVGIKGILFTTAEELKKKLKLFE